MSIEGINTIVNPPEEPGTPQGNLLRHAITLVEHDRNQTYGAPHEDFGRTAGQLNALGYRGPVSGRECTCGGTRELMPRDWPVMSNAAKQSRLVNTPDHYDSIADIAGYAGCYQECILAEEENGQA